MKYCCINIHLTLFQHVRTVLTLFQCVSSIFILHWVLTIEELMCFNLWQLYFSSKFNVLQCNKSLAAGFIPNNTWQQRASLPLKPTQGHHLQVKIYCRWRFIETWPNYFNYHKIRSFSIPDRWQSKSSEQSINSDYKSLETVFSIAVCGKLDDKDNQQLYF